MKSRSLLIIVLLIDPAEYIYLIKTEVAKEALWSSWNMHVYTYVRSHIDCWEYNCC